MFEHPKLVNKDRAERLISELQHSISHNVIELLAAGVERFFSEQPSQLRSPFDLAFFVEVLKDRIELVHSCLDGTQEAKGWWEEDEFPLPSTVADAVADVSETGIRSKQAYNYIAIREGRRLQAALLTLMNGAYVRQRLGGRYATGSNAGKPVEPLHPDYPFDYLFMVMAVDYARRPGQPLRQLLEITY